MKLYTKIVIMMPMCVRIFKRPKTCDICGCKSKVEIFIAAIGGGGPELLCPGEKKYPRIHEILEKKLYKLDEDGHPKSYIKELEKEITELDKKFNGIPTLEKYGGNLPMCKW